MTTLLAMFMFTACVPPKKMPAKASKQPVAPLIQPMATPIAIPQNSKRKMAVVAPSYFDMAHIVSNMVLIATQSYKSDDMLFKKGLYGQLDNMEKLAKGTDKEEVTAEIYKRVRQGLEMMDNNRLDEAYKLLQNLN